MNKQKEISIKRRIDSLDKLIRNSTYDYNEVYFTFSKQCISNMNTKTWRAALNNLKKELNK